MLINRFIKKRNIESNVVTPPQLYAHGLTDLTKFVFKMFLKIQLTIQNHT